MTANVKKLLVPVAVILACALVLFGLTAALAGTAEAKEAELLDTLMEYMLPGGGEYEFEEYTGADANIVGVYRGEEGCVVDTVVPGFRTDVRTLVGVYNDGLVYSVCVLENNNTYGLGMEASGDWDFLCQLVNSNGDLTVGGNVDGITGATITSGTVVSAVNSASRFMSDSASGGPLTGVADGFAGPITVEVTMDGDTITAVTVTSNSETPSIAGAALEQIPQAIVEANSADVDVVAGATYTSNGIINAVKDAIGAAE